MEPLDNLTVNQYNEQLSAENARDAVLYIEFEMFVRGVMALEDWKETLQKVFEYVHLIFCWAMLTHLGKQEQT